MATLQEQQAAAFAKGIPFTSAGALTKEPVLVGGNPPPPINLGSPTPTSTPTPNPTPTSTPTQTPTPSTAETLLSTATTARDLLQKQLAGGEPTIGETLSGSFSAPEFSSPTPQPDLSVDENAIRRQQLRLHQAEIDATNQVYDQLLNEARLQGQGRLGSTRAIGARGGILGSDFAASQKQGQIQANTAEQRAIQAERQAKIGSIMGEVRKSVADEIAAKRLARQQDAESYLDYLSREKETKQGNINLFAQSLLSQGLDITDLDENEIATFAQEIGTTPQNLQAAYSIVKASADSAAAESDLETRKTEAEIKKIEADIANGKIKSIGEGTMLYNTETGETFKNPKTYKPGSSGSLSISGQTLTQGQIADVHSLLDESRGEDKYADTGEYISQLRGFVQLGGDPKDFVKEYEPDIYINPNDPTRSFLQQYMRKTDQPDVFLGSLGGIDFNSAIAEAAAQ